MKGADGNFTSFAGIDPITKNLYFSEVGEIIIRATIGTIVVDKKVTISNEPITQASVDKDAKYLLS